MALSLMRRLSAFQTAGMAALGTYATFPTADKRPVLARNRISQSFDRCLFMSSRPSSDRHYRRRMQTVRAAIMPPTVRRDQPNPSPSALRPLRLDAFSCEHRRGGGLLGCPLRAADPFRRLAIGDLDNDPELGIVIGSRALELAVERRRHAAGLGPFLQHGLGVA